MPFSNMSNSERNKMCEKYRLSDRYGRYRNELNATYLNPEGLGYDTKGAHLNRFPHPKGNPRPKWTPPCSYGIPLYRCRPHSKPLNCGPHWTLKETIQKRLQECSPHIPDVGQRQCIQTEIKPTVKFIRIDCNLDDMPKPKPAILPVDKPCECDTTFKPLPPFKPKFGCITDELVPLTYPTSLSVKKCVPQPRHTDLSSGTSDCKCRTTPECTPQFVGCGCGGVDIDMSQYVRQPRPECYIKNGGGRKADRPERVSVQPIENLMPQSDHKKKTVKLTDSGSTHGVVENLHVRHSGVTTNNGPSTATVQEQCGLNTKYPGTTETHDRYQKPTRPGKPTEFKINPPVGSVDRPHDKKVVMPWITEYQYRYKWPSVSRRNKSAN